MYKSTLVILSIVSVMFLVAACQTSDVAPLEAQNEQPGRLAKATTETIVETVEFTSTNFVPCANDGAGEVVAFELSEHIVTHYTIDGTGTYHWSIHSNTSGTGVGQVTGDTYIASGNDNDTFNGASPPFERTFVGKRSIIGPGPGNNLTAHVTRHLTVNANGEVTTTVVNMNMDCK